MTPTRTSLLASLAVHRVDAADGEVQLLPVQEYHLALSLLFLCKEERDPTDTRRPYEVPYERLRDHMAPKVGRVERPAIGGMFTADPDKRAPRVVYEPTRANRTALTRKVAALDAHGVIVRQRKWFLNSDGKRVDDGPGTPYLFAFAYPENAPELDGAAYDELLAFWRTKPDPHVCAIVARTRCALADARTPLGGEWHEHEARTGVNRKTIRRWAAKSPWLSVDEDVVNPNGGTAKYAVIRLHLVPDFDERDSDKLLAGLDLDGEVPDLDKAVAEIPWRTQKAVARSAPAPTLAAIPAATDTTPVALTITSEAPEPDPLPETPVSTPAVDALAHLNRVDGPLVLPARKRVRGATAAERKQQAHLALYGDD